MSSHSKLQDVAEQIHSQFHARKHLQKKMVVDVKRMGRSEIRAAIEEQAGMNDCSSLNACFLVFSSEGGKKDWVMKCI